MKDNEIDELLPEDDIPNDLHFETIPEDNDAATVSLALFRDWLQEGRFNCDVAQMLLAFWIDDRAQSRHYETLDDFFSSLVSQRKAEVDIPQASDEHEDTLTVGWLGEFIIQHCNVPYSAPEASLESLLPELIQRIKDEIVAVQSYVNTWRGSTTVQKAEGQNVLESMKCRVEDVMHPWPTIQQDPTPWSDDARFAKAFPLSFPMGTGDFRQPRLRNDFSSLDWTQHVFCFFTGHMQSSMRGHRYQQIVHEN